MRIEQQNQVNSIQRQIYEAIENTPDITFEMALCAIQSAELKLVQNKNKFKKDKL